MEEKSEIGKIILAFVIGGVVGALTGILLAPASGAETRKKIKDASLTAKEKALEKIEDAKDGASNIFARGKEKVNELKSSVAAAVEAGKEAYKQKKEELTSESSEEEA
ncbi:MAG: YtxH domain-containing protein [Candidatus Poribacteria bacterium]